MRRFVIIGMLLMALAPGLTRAQDADAAIQGVIAGQIEAFKVDDFDTAFSFASPAIKRLFGNAERFGEMVQNGYPMVWRPAEVRFSGLETRGGRTVQSVLVTDAAGAIHVLDYEMQRGDDGWLINGVTLRRAGHAGA